MTQLSKAENTQYSRHLLLDEIGLVGQNRLNKAKVLVIGAGGLGCSVLQYLTAAGIGTIGIVDHDIVDQSNLQRQILYSHDDLGHKKAEQAQKKLALLNPFIDFDVFVDKLDHNNAIELFQNFDIIVDGSDNFPTRYLINDAAVLTNKPVVSASIYKFEGQLSVYNYKQGPTYRCLFPTPPVESALTNCSEIGVLGVLPGIIGCLQANEVIKIICKLDHILTGKLFTFDAITLKQNIFSFKKNNGIHITTLLKDYGAYCGNETETLELSIEELQSNESEYQLLDVRTKTERNNAHIGGIHIPISELSDRCDELPQKQDIVVYCQSGITSLAAIKLLKQVGCKNKLINLKGGIVQINN